MDKLRAKRVRPWDSCDDVQELRRMLSEKDEELVQVLIEKEEQHKKLRQVQLLSDNPAGAASSTLSSKELEQSVKKMLSLIQKQINSQMVYQPSLKHGSAQLTAEVPNISEEMVKCILGADLLAKAKEAPKQLKVDASNEELEGIFGKRFYKRLRFGADLQLSDGLTFLFVKADNHLNVTGSYAMQK
ncbi:hypothetical protein O6H91_11G027200 [Diphasiastrum complanatum]|uniref:Uncharacterized protein n=2 Tax=Diphasiastrum complanatum TaxID=34168 RepID=A0ACC2C7A6_DIPCM|nr:hypothetical protein O6H91_11G027000 [Diphasiastrum complanatum]KAJ7537903.1 hypothetical protein O6H91_11G027200 [Diphasiastrum complanatum]